MDNSTKQEKWRHEYKYICNACQRQILKMRANGTMHLDKHAQGSSGYTIRSLYFDDIYNSCFSENENGNDLRSKYRIRIYNGQSDVIFLEKKSKKCGMVSKKSGRISREDCVQLMKGKFPDIINVEDSSANEILLEMQCKGMRPVVIVEYNRIPYVEKQGNVRVTFDSSIVCSNNIELFLEKNIMGRLLFTQGKSLVEVKWDGYMPRYIKENLSMDSLSWTTFSKYYLCRKMNCQGGILL